MEVASGAFGVIERDQNARVDGLTGEPLLFVFRAVAPVNAIGFRQARNIGDPSESARLLVAASLRSSRNFGVTATEAPSVERDFTI